MSAKIAEITAAEVFARLPVRRAESQKGNYGRLFCVAGSLPYRGAAALAVEGALRVGAGIVTLAAIEPVIAGVVARLPECTFLPCAQGEEGGIAGAEAARLAEAATGRTLLVGPGLGNTPDTAALLRALCAVPVRHAVADADALNVLAGWETWPALSGWVLTPHPGEMARLCRCTVAEVCAEPVRFATALAQKCGAVVVLKGHRTLVATPTGGLWRNTTGNAGLARGGSGDVLAGLLAGLLAQGLPPEDAAPCAVWLHGAAADACAKAHGQMGMLPHDLLPALGRIFAENGR